MANKTIHELSSIANLSSSDELAIYDVSGLVTGNGTIEGILGTDITGLDTTATNLIDAVNQHEETLSQNDLLYADDEEESTEEVEFVSQDDTLSPSSTASFVSVDLLSGSDGWSQRFVKVSQMFKNIRTLISKIGSSSMGTTAITITGAIAQHGSNISTLNSNSVIETGQTNNWTYRKWQNGIVECWTRVDRTISIAAGSIATFNNVQFPFTFTLNPVISVNGGGSGQPQVAPFYANAITTQADIWIANRSSSAFNNNVTVHIYVMGYI